MKIGLIFIIMLDKPWTRAYSTDSGLAGGDAPRPLAASQQWKQSPIPIINTVSNPNSPHSLQSQLNTQSSI